MKSLFWCLKHSVWSLSDSFFCALTKLPSSLLAILLCQGGLLRESSSFDQSLFSLQMSKYCLLLLYIEVVANRFSRCEAPCYIPIKLNNIGEPAWRTKTPPPLRLIIIFVSKISPPMQQPQPQLSTARKQPSNTARLSPNPNFKQIGNFHLANIRESGYKIFRSNSKRSEHSLSAKKPIRVQQKLKEMQQSSNNLQKGYNKKDPKKKIIGWKEKSVIGNSEDENNVSRSIDLNKIYIVEQSTVKQTTNMECSMMEGSRDKEEIVLLRSIWENLKQLKEKTKFIVEVIEMELVLHKMLAKIASNAPDSQKINEAEEKVQQFLTATCETQIHSLKLNQTKSDGHSSQQKLYHELQSKRLMYIVDEEKKESHSSMSLKIQNEQLHSREFLHSYHDDIVQTHLKDITYYDQKRNSFENSEKNKWSSYNDYSSESPVESQRVTLKTIVKKKNTPRNQQCIVSTCDQVGTICRKAKLQQKSEPYCQLFDCERVQGSKENILSSQGSQSKRSALNQIILMLNQKYHKNLKQVSPKIHF